MDIYIIGALLLISGAFYFLTPMLMPFILGIMFAYLLAPTVGKLNNHIKSRTVSTLIPLLIFICIILGGFMVGVPFIMEDISDFIQKAPQYAQWLEKALNEGGVIYNFAEKWNLPIDKNTIKTQVYTYSDQIALAALDTLQRTALGAMAIFDALSLIVITPLVTFYVLYDWPAFTKKITNLVPQDLRKNTLNIFGDIDIKLSKFLRGQLAVCLILGLFYGTALGLSGLNMGFFVGLATGLLSFIPFIGMALGLIFALVLAVMQYQLSGVEPYVIILTIFAVGQILEGFVLTPKLVGGSTGLHPVWVIFAVMAGGELGGFLGMLIALPLATILTVLIPVSIKVWLNQRTAHKKKVQ
jgi:predicted PurR-regulated permease PerM